MNIDKRDLAIKYIQNKLNNMDKLLVYDLLSNDSDFKEIFNEEFNFYKGMIPLKKTLEYSKKEELLNKISLKIKKEQKKEAFLFRDIMEYGLRLTLSPFFTNMIKKIILYSNPAYNITK